MSGPLKIGLLVDGDSVPLWAAEIIKRLTASDYAQVTLVVKNMLPGEPAQIRERESAPSGSALSFAMKLRRNASKLGYIGFGFLDQGLNIIEPTKRNSETAYDSEQPLSELLPDVRVIEVTPEKLKFSDFVSNENVEQIKQAEVDILFRLGFRILRGGILKAARYGIWSYHHGDNRMMRGGPSGFWEMVTAAPTVGVILQILNEDLDGGTVLTRSWHLPDIVKLNRQRQNVFMQALSHFPRQVKRLHDLGEDAYFAEIECQNQHPDYYSKRLFVAPNNRKALWYIGQHYLRYLAAKIRRLFFFRQWILLASFRPTGQISKSMWRYKPLLPPRDRGWADPFVIERDGKYYVFLEEIVYAKGHGHISVMTVEVGSNGRFERTDPVPVIEQPYHMSYPFLLEYQDELYMIPETAENRTIDLYRCTRFPDKWELVSTLMDDVVAVDATLLEHEGRWWMFATVRENEGTNCLDELHIFHADSPLSTDWQPHKKNPVSTDVRNARPAGAIQKHKGSLYRPAQNGSVRYGYGMHINLIELLNENDYQETIVSSIEPDWDRTINATHTLNHTGNLSVSDASKVRFRFFRDKPGD